MFCPNCGKRCDGGAYCWNCGAKLPVSSAVATDAEPEKAPVPEAAHEPASAARPHAVVSDEGSPVPQKPKDAGAAVAEGAIFTNLKALAAKLNTDTGTLRRLLSAYAAAALSRGVRYHLIDASEYVWMNPGAKPGSTARLSPSDSWVEHIALLADYFRYGRSRDKEETNYLFIVGGEDVIPMPVVPHYMADRPGIGEKDIDTDIPYAYMLGERTYPLLKSGELFNYEQYFHVGRLPFPTDASLDDLTGYLRRVAKCSGTVLLKRYYGQVNMPWGEDSQVVCEPLRRRGLHTTAHDYESSYADVGGERMSVARNGLYYSIPVVEENVDQIFDADADFYYFNLHGSDAPTTSGFVADYRQVGYGAISPRQLASVRTPNFLVSEACYGAKFMQYSRDRSMLLAAITSRTLLYLGSSRSAFCNNCYPIDNSDRLANIYIGELFNGHTAGEALYLARRSFFEYDEGRLYDQQMVSIVEFNIFGDPTLRAHGEGTAARSLPEGVSVMTKNPVYTVSWQECLYKSDPGRPESLLEEVRGLVDRNIMRIREVVDRTLYERLGVEPRSLSAIFRNRFADGKMFYSFDYVENNRYFSRVHTVITSPDGEVKTIISTK